MFGAGHDASRWPSQRSEDRHRKANAGANDIPYLKLIKYNKMKKHKTFSLSFCKDLGVYDICLCHVSMNISISSALQVLYQLFRIFRVRNQETFLYEQRLSSREYGLSLFELSDSQSIGQRYLLQRVSC